MTLREWLTANKQTDDEFAAAMGGDVTARAVRKWRYGETTPRVPELVRIEEVTNGAVTLRDFLPSPSPDEAAA